MFQPISMIRGTTYSFILSIRDEDNLPYIAPQSNIIRFGVKRNPEDSSYIIVKEQNGDENLTGEYSFVINPDDTLHLKFGTYFYDIGLETDNGDYFMVIECSPFNIKKNITSLEVQNE